MLLKLEENVIINSDQIVSITYSGSPKMPSLITMSDSTLHLHKKEPEFLANIIVKLQAQADTYYFTHI